MRKKNRKTLASAVAQSCLLVKRCFKSANRVARIISGVELARRAQYLFTYFGEIRQCLPKGEKMSDIDRKKRATIFMSDDCDDLIRGSYKSMFLYYQNIKLIKEQIGTIINNPYTGKPYRIVADAHIDENGVAQYDFKPYFALPSKRGRAN